MKDHFGKLERMYLSANINKDLFDTTTIKIEKRSAEIGLTVHPKYFHALGAIHGSVYFKLLDDAAFFAVNSIVTDVFVLTKSFELQFKRPVKSGKLKAIGSVIETRTDTYIAEAKMYNEFEKLVAEGSGEFVKSKVALTQEIGYQ